MMIILARLMISLDKNKKKKGKHKQLKFNVKYTLKHSVFKYERMEESVADLGGGDVGGRLLLPPRYSIPCQPKGSPLCTILRYPFMADLP